MSILDKFPKTRPELPPEFQEIYAAQYKENRDGGSTASGLAQKLESWMHKKVAADAGPDFSGSTLEIGAGTLNQIKYENHGGIYDIVEPFSELYEGSPDLARVNAVYSDISEIPDGTKYDRIISVATFEHICDLPAVIARCGLMLNEGGSLRCGIPSEGTILWKLGYTMTTGLEFKRKYGLDYEVLMRHEHVNTAKEIEGVLRYFFEDVRGSSFGIANALSLYQFYACRGAKGNVAETFLAGGKAA
jgi:hypothetical protein